MFEELETLDYDDSPTPMPKLGVGRQASQLLDSSPPRMPQSFCSEDGETEKLGEKENYAPQMEMAQDINGPGNKEVLLANFCIPKISRPFRAPLLEMDSLEPNIAAFQKEGVAERANIALATAASKNAHKNAKVDTRPPRPDWPDKKKK
uniref:Uncharacterized protein n=1 Tax=Romanomermis culicivorax TaxID=13658 RepID=A0A915JWY3_ROMCU